MHTSLISVFEGLFTPEVAIFRLMKRKRALNSTACAGFPSPTQPYSIKYEYTNFTNLVRTPVCHSNSSMTSECKQTELVSPVFQPIRTRHYTQHSAYFTTTFVWFVGHTSVRTVPIITLQTPKSQDFFFPLWSVRPFLCFT